MSQRAGQPALLFWGRVSGQLGTSHKSSRRIDREQLHVKAHDAVRFHNRRRGLLAWKRLGVRRPRSASAGARLSRAPAQARSLSQRRSRHDEPLPARRGLRHRRRRRDRSRSRPLRAFHRRDRARATTTSRPAASIRHHRPRSAAATISARPCRSFRTSPTRSRISSRPATTASDFVLVEIGGTVGDIEGLPFLEAIRQLGQELPRGTAVFIHLTLLPFIPSAGELKTKPTQHSVRELRSIGIQPDILLCRIERHIPKEERRKIVIVLQCARERRHRGARRSIHL